MNLFSAWLVHLYTATGAVAAFLGTIAVFGARYREAFLWMMAATVVDATDGLLARRARVRERLPEIDGARLDDIVDYLTFVFLPVLLLYHSGAVSEGWGAAVGSIILLSSAFGFVAPDAKTDDHFFTGFPSYWNIVALYLYIGLQLGVLTPALNGLILLGFCALIFWRVRYVYPSRTPVLRGLTMALSAAWTAVVLAMVLMLPAVPPALVLGSFFFPIYYVFLSAALHARRRRTASAQS
jgi:phosphatidylcholine synthase